MQDSSRFFNSKVMYEALIEAENIYKNNPTERTIHIQTDEMAGEGYMGNTKKNIRMNVVGEYRQTRVVTVRIEEKVGKAFNAFPNLSAGQAYPDPLKHTG